MVEIKNLIDKKNKDNSEAYNRKFAIGINEVLYTDRYVYKFLRLKDFDKYDGELFINENKYIPNESEDKTLFVLAIASQVFCLSIGIISSLNNKNDTLKKLQDELMTLRDYPIVTDEEISKKIDAINEIISHYDVAYVLVDENNEVNSDHIALINKSIEKYLNDMTYIFLLEDGVNQIKENPNVNNIAKENLLSHENVLDICIGNSVDGQNSSNNTINEKKNNKADFKELIKKTKPILKDNITSFLLYMLEILFTVFLAIIGPYLLSSEGATFASVVVIILLVFCFFAAIFISSLIVEPNKKIKVDQKFNFKVLVSSLLVSTLLGIALGYVVFIIFKCTNFVIKAENWNDSLIITSIIVSVITLVIPFVSKYINILINKIKKSFISNKK